MPTQYQNVLDETRARVQEVDTVRAREMIANGAQVLDVREADEVELGVIAGAVVIPRGFLEMRAEEQLPDKNREIVIYCAGGVRSLFAADALQQLGYTSPVSLAGGFGAWKAKGLPFSVPKAFTQ